MQPTAGWSWSRLALVAIGPEMKRTRKRQARQASRASKASELPLQLKAWRKRNRLSQSAAAVKLRMSRRTLQEWEQGRAAPRNLALIAISDRIR